MQLFRCLLNLSTITLIYLSIYLKFYRELFVKYYVFNTPIKYYIL